MGDLSRHVSILDTRNRKTCWVDLSNFCPKCGGDRGKPTLITQIFDGRGYTYHKWTNKCGHVESETSLLNEVAAQCAIAKCTLLCSAYCAPYCGADCTHLAVTELIARLGGAVTEIDEVVGMINGLRDIMENFELPDAEGEKITAELEDSQKQLAGAQEMISTASELVASAAGAADLRPILKI